MVGNFPDKKKNNKSSPVSIDRWYLGVWMCDAWLSIDYCASTASIFNLCVLSLDRYWSITSPLKYLRRRTKKRAFLMIAAAWALSLLWILPVTGWSHMVGKDTTTNSSSSNKLNAPDSCDTEFADNITFKVSPRSIYYVIDQSIDSDWRKSFENQLKVGGVSQSGWLTAT